MNVLRTCHGEITLPTFLPDATRAVVKGVDASDLMECGVGALMVNVLHLSAHPGAGLLASVGGIHRYMGWPGPIASDSGGFQAFSLARGSRKLCRISDNGFTYQLEKDQPKKSLTPERCIRQQFRLGSDIMFCLDHCTRPDIDFRTQRESLVHTVAWAKRCKQEFDRQMEERGGEVSGRPLLFAVVQGGDLLDLRRECAERLLEIGFDGFAYGGWPTSENARLLQSVGYVADLIPKEYPKHALGIGKPENVLKAFEFGYDLFDCVLPTRDARYERLFAFTGRLEDLMPTTESFYERLYMQDEKHARDGGPIEADCDCLCCRRYSRAYLHHLFRLKDPLSVRLATIHNLRFYMRLMKRLQKLRQTAQ